MKQRVVCYFSASQVEQPVISTLVRKYDLTVNILKADINPQKEGYLVMELSGEKNDFEAGVDYLRDVGVQVESLSQTVIWHEDQCTQCGACASFCPTGSLAVERETMEVSFDNDKCVVCGMCLDCCPTRAVELYFHIARTLVS